MMDLSFFKSKKVLMTGHTGFKGSWLCRILMNAGASVTGYSLEPAGEPNLFSLAGLEQGIRSETGDVRDYCRLAGLFKEIRPEIVFHLAAQPIVREGYLNPKVVQKIWSDFTKEGGAYQPLIWYILMFEQWIEYDIM